MTMEPTAESANAPPTTKLPDSGVLTSWAAKDIKKLTPAAAGAALLETFGRRCSGGDLLEKEDEPLPVGRGQTLRSIRTRLGNNRYRLIYFQVRPKNAKNPAPQTTQVALSVSRLRFVGLLAWEKKRTNVGEKGGVAWKRSELWLKDHPEFERA
jgi:hypothetical protein